MWVGGRIAEASRCFYVGRQVHDTLCRGVTAREVIVLHAVGQPVQRPAPLARRDLLLGDPGGGPRRIGHHQDVAANFVVDRGDARQIGLDEVNGRHGARPDGLRGLLHREFEQVIHAGFPVSSQTPTPSRM